MRLSTGGRDRRSNGDRRGDTVVAARSEPAVNGTGGTFSAGGVIGTGGVLDTGQDDWKRVGLWALAG